MAGAALQCGAPLAISRALGPSCLGPKLYLLGCYAPCWLSFHSPLSLGMLVLILHLDISK